MNAEIFQLKTGRTRKTRTLTTPWILSSADKLSIDHDGFSLTM
ncbi:Uncharacterised protein [Vibrio cholerae]|nr:Uncharacterised protein [Vibrio cholerae]